MSWHPPISETTSEAGENEEEFHILALKRLEDVEEE